MTIDLDAIEKRLQTVVRCDCDDYCPGELYDLAARPISQDANILLERVRELESGQQHHANIIDRLHTKIDELQQRLDDRNRDDLNESLSAMEDQ